MQSDAGIKISLAIAPQFMQSDGLKKAAPVEI